ELAKGYQLIPAAVDFLPPGLSLGVKWGKNSQDKWFKSITVDGVQYMWYPDRTLMLMMYRKSKTGILREAPDEILDLNPLSNSTMYEELGYKYLMVSSTNMNFT